MVEKNRQVKVKSSNKGLNELESFIEEICYEYNIINTYYSNIQLALNEVFTNSRVYKEADNQANDIEILFFSDQKGLHFVLKEEQEGFDFKDFQNLDMYEDDLSEESKGMLIIKMLVDELNIADSMKAIELVFYISSINYSLTVERKKHLENYFKNVTLYKAM